MTAPLRYNASEALGEINGSVVVIIRGGLIKFVNSAVTKLLGYSTQEVLNKQFPKFVANEYEDMVLDRYKKRLMDEDVPSVCRKRPRGNSAGPDEVQKNAGGCLPVLRSSAHFQD